MKKKLAVLMILLFCLCGCEKEIDDEYYDYFVKCAKSEACLRIDNLYGFDEESEYTLRVHVLDKGKIPYYFFVEQNGNPLFGMQFEYEKDNQPSNVATYKWKSGWLYACVNEIKTANTKDIPNWDKSDPKVKLNDMLSVSNVKVINKSEFEMKTEIREKIVNNLPSDAAKVASRLEHMQGDIYEIRGFVKQYTIERSFDETEITLKQSEIVLAIMYRNEKPCYILSYDLYDGEMNGAIPIEETDDYYKQMANIRPVMMVSIGEYPYTRTLTLCKEDNTNALLIQQASPLPAIAEKAKAEIKRLASLCDEEETLFKGTVS